MQAYSSLPSMYKTCYIPPVSISDSYVKCVYHGWKFIWLTVQGVFGGWLCKHLLPSRSQISHSQKESRHSAHLFMQMYFFHKQFRNNKPKLWLNKLFLGPVYERIFHHILFILTAVTCTLYIKMTKAILGVIIFRAFWLD